MSLCRSITFLEASADARESPASVKGLQLNDQFDCVDGPGFSKEDDCSVAPFGPSSLSIKLGVQGPSSSPIWCSFSSSAFAAG